LIGRQRRGDKNVATGSCEEIGFCLSSKICHGAYCVIAVRRTFGFLYVRDFGVSA
jgi:hypothetical protein